MEPRISLVTLGVADMPRARRCYEALGWRASGPATRTFRWRRTGASGCRGNSPSSFPQKRE